MIIETQQLASEEREVAADQPRPRRRLLTIACWAYLAGMVAVWLFLRQEGDRWWPATLLMVSPRWPFAAVASVLWLWVIAARKWQHGLILGGATAVLLGPFMGLRISLPAGSDERGDLRLLTCNIHRNQVDAGKLAAYITATAPDVVVLQDWSNAHQDTLFHAAEWNIRREGELLIASRFPVARITHVDFKDVVQGAINERGAAVCYDLQTPAGMVRLVNVHLASPHNGLLTFMNDRGQQLEDNANRRWLESAAVRRVVDESNDPVLLAGDFNTTDDSPIFREHWADFTDAFTDRGLGIGYTYLNRHTQLRIDHVLAGPAWQVVRCWTGPAVGSPHHPLVADLRVR